jgi:molybdopterin synthase sulfur carrier subunit
LRVKLFGNLRGLAGLASGQTTTSATGGTAGEVLLDLCARHPALREAIFDGRSLAPYVRVMVNGQDIELADGLDTTVAEGDQLAIFPPIAGGLIK